MNKKSMKCKNVVQQCMNNENVSFEFAAPAYKNCKLFLFNLKGKLIYKNYVNDLGLREHAMSANS